MLEIGEPWPAWHSLVRRGTWRRSGIRRDVLAFLGTQPVDDVEAVAREAAPAVAIRDPGVLPLLGVERVGEGVAWLYAFREVVSPVFFAKPILGHRAAAQLVAKVARLVEAHPHPGPNVEDVLLDADGNVLLASFVGPLPTYARAPGGDEGEAAVVYRLGALLATLLAGAIKEGSTASSHDAAVRRTVIRAMSMPGAVFSDRYANWLQGMLAWDPDARPPLSRVAGALEELAAASGGLPLQAVVRKDFRLWLEAATGFQGTDLGDPSLDASGINHPTFDPEYAGRTTLANDPVPELAFVDEPTVESELYDPVERTPPSVLERGSIPVEVGPPVEAVRRRPPKLPPGFLDPRSGDTQPSPAPRKRVPSLPPRPATDPNPATPGWVLPVAALLTGTAVVLALWLVFG